MFDDVVSTYRTFNGDPVSIPLQNWIHSTMNPKCRFAGQVERYRHTGDMNAKKSLPCVTVSAICEEGHKKTDVVKRTGWIALDIDDKDNPHLADAESLRDEIAKIRFVAYAGLSVSGKGVWALVKVKDPQKQALYFKQLQADFNYLGITLDSSKGRNPNDLRFYSFDPDAYVADEFAIYDRLPIKRSPKRKEPTAPVEENGSYTTLEKVEALVSQIETRRIDITGGYANWRNLGFAFEDEFGEGGRRYFHRISQFHPDYDRRECDKQFTNCIEHDGFGVGIGTFFHLCREYDVTLIEENKVVHDHNDGAPYGSNPYTGEVFDERGYPADWDTIALDEMTELKDEQLN